VSGEDGVGMEVFFRAIVGHFEDKKWLFDLFV
jgi:hypothetical protein